MQTQTFSQIWSNKKKTILSWKDVIGQTFSLITSTLIGLEKTGWNQILGNENSFQISYIFLNSIKRERSYDFSKQLKITSPRQKNRADCEKSSDQGEVKFRPTHPPNL